MFDTKTYKELREKHFKYTFKLAKTYPDAEDIFQKTIIKVFEKDYLNDSSIQNIDNYIRGIIYKRFLDHRNNHLDGKSDNIDFTSPEGLVKEPFYEPFNEPNVEVQQEDIGKVLDVLLTPFEKNVVQMHDIKGIPFDSLTNDLARSKNTIMKYHGIAKKKLKTKDFKDFLSS